MLQAQAETAAELGSLKEQLTAEVRYQAAPMYIHCTFAA